MPESLRIPRLPAGALVCAALSLGAAATANASLDLTKVGHFKAPTYVTSAPGDAKRLFVTERSMLEEFGSRCG